MKRKCSSIKYLRKDKPDEDGYRVNPKFCVNSNWGANRAKMVQGGSRVNPAAVLTTT